MDIDLLPFVSLAPCLPFIPSQIPSIEHGRTHMRFTMCLWRSLTPLNPFRIFKTPKGPPKDL